jgi:hypothetical protein
VDRFALVLELDRLEALIEAELGAVARDLWDGVRAAAPPPVLGAASTRAVLARTRDSSPRAAQLWRLALGAATAAADRARDTPGPARTEEAFRAAAETRRAIARHHGFADPWALARAIAGEPDQPPPAPPPAPLDGLPTTDEVPALDVDALIAAHGVDPGAIRIEIVDGDAPVPGRTFIVARGRDVRVRVWRRPGASPRGVLRVLLHELGHAIPAARGLAPPCAALDEAIAAWFAGLLERDEVAGAAVAAAERAGRQRRRTRLAALARAEHDFYRADGPPPWQSALAWTDPGASGSYARAEELRDGFGDRLDLAALLA